MNTDEQVLRAFNEGRLFTLGGIPVTDSAVLKVTRPWNLLIKGADATPASVATVDEVVTVDSPYDQFKAQMSQAYKGAK